MMTVEIEKEQLIHLVLMVGSALWPVEGFGWLRGGPKGCWPKAALPLHAFPFYR